MAWIKSLKQGDCDYFCCLYSITNALSKLASPKLGYRSQIYVFNRLLEKLVSIGGLQNIEKKGVSVPQEIMGYLKTDMERIINKQNEAHNREVKAVRKQYDDCQDKIKRLRSLLLEGHITPEEYRDMNEDLKKEQYELEGKSELLTKADKKFSIAISTILSLGNNAYQIFQSSKVETKREILHLLLSNLKLQDRRISYNLRKPFDYISSLNKKTPPKIEGVAIGDA